MKRLSILLGLIVAASWVAGPAPMRGQETPPSSDVTPADLDLLGDPRGRALTGDELESATDRVAAELRCPVCQGLSVADSHTLTAIAMKAKAGRLLAAGYTEEQVLTYFEASYGEFIRLSPKAEGFNLLVWLLPVVAIAAGIALIVLRVRSASRRTRPGSGEDEELDAYRERVRREISG